MKRIDFENFLSLISQDLYSYAYVLIPDDLQAGQLIFDSITAYLISRKDNLDTLFTSKSKDLSNELIPLKKELLKLVYDLAKKRFHQLKLSIDIKENLEGFYSLDFDEKSCLFLKDKAKYSVDDIATITNKSRNEVLANLYSARVKMIDKVSVEFNVGVSL